MLVPGVLGVRAPESLTDARGGPQMNANGNRGNQNLYTFDGALFINPSRNTGMNLPTARCRARISAPDLQF